MDTCHFDSEPVAHRNVANARERNRTSSVNIAFSVLRTRIPTEPRDRRLSKVETLRLATSYIRHLANTVTARAEGYNGGHVCKEFKYNFHEVDCPEKKRICTFCLSERKKRMGIAVSEKIGDENRKQSL
ncbi:hypothetical protein JTE90_008103 [Oedothorax gibbosus]|uniref:BHLH domain-containing protein n=1 Tax=Oedothorax gibbosus TaxID=931172 RepID=A0AAV6UZF8_9ARAC|nr:hypothetical protein JTE90_008103 [Oedothorax gibbosus]